MEMISKYGINRENHSSFDGTTWCVASRGVTKGSVYCTPRMPKSIVSPSSSSHMMTRWSHHIPTRWSYHIPIHRIEHCKRR